MLKQSLHQNWTVRPVSNLENVPSNCRESTLATVPGCVHTDLLRAAKIPEPYYDRNEPTLRWIGQTDWRYETTFKAEAALFDHERIELVCDGLDTIATIELNGHVIGKSENMHVAQRFDVRKALKKGENRLAITFASAEHYAFEMEKRLGKLPFLNTRVPFNMIRKMACNFGWDWGPEFITCGIWRGIRLEGWSAARFDTVFTQVRESDASTVIVRAKIELSHRQFEKGMFTVHAELIRPDHRQVVAEAFVPCDSETGAAELQLKVREPQQWHPVGHGEQPLYTLLLSLGEGSDIVTTVDKWRRRIGLRTVQLDTTPDDIGRPFTLKVNGKPIFCKGFNWIPDDCFLDRACAPERYRTRIQQALDANANMLRVWGGGIFETDEFYDLCDEMGMLVWQDFLFACAAYPEEEPIKSLVEQEVRHNVSRLAHHPSLVVWNGCNENLWGYHDWGWKAEGKVNDRTWGPGYYFDLIPKIVEELDPSRPYWAGSPWSGDTDVDNGLHPNLASHGNKHVWEVWAEHYDVFRKFIPRFCSEFGFQAPPTYATLAGCMPADQIRIGSESMKLHQKSPSWDTQVSKRVNDVWGENPQRTFDEQHYLLQVNQARALQTGVEWFRSRAPVCMGTLYWQLNDCWPVNSWSAIDGDGRLKPLWYATRRFYAPRLLTIQPRQDMLELCVINDSDEPWQDEAVLTMHRFDGSRREVWRTPIDVAPRSVQRIALGQAGILRPDRVNEFLVAQVREERCFWFYETDSKLKYPVPRYSTDLKMIGDRTMLTLFAESFLRDIVVQADRIDPAAVVNEQLVTLLPGERFVFEIKSTKKLTHAVLTSPPVLQCTNAFGGK